MKKEENEILINSNKALHKFCLDEFYDKIGYTTFHFKLFFISALILYVEGCEMVIVNLLLKLISQEMHLTRLQRSLVGSSVFIGFFIGSIFSGLISNKYGRKPPILYGIFLLMVSTFLSCIVYNFASLFINRIFVGFALGIIVSALLCIITESIKSEYRSLILSLVWVLYPIGIIYLAFFAMNFIKFDKIDWRRMFFLNALNSLPIFVLSFFLSESPRYLIVKSQYNHAWSILNKMSKMIKLSNQDKEGLVYENEFNQEEMKTDFFNCVKTLFDEKLRKQTILIYSLWFITSMISFGLLYILPKILVLYDYKNRNKSYNDIMAITFILFPAPMFRGILSEIKVIGRKLCMFIGYLFGFLTCVVCIYNTNNLLFFVCTVKFFISISNGIVSVYTCEIYDTNIRSICLGLGYAIARLGAIFAPLFSEMFDNKLEYGTFYFILTCCMICMILSITLPVETFEKNLDENLKNDNFLAKLERNIL